MCTREQDANHAFASCAGEREFCAEGVCATYSKGVSITIDGSGKVLYDVLKAVSYTSGRSGTFITTASGIPSSVNGQSCTRIIVRCTTGSSNCYDDCSNIQAGAFVDNCNVPY
jgi:hypothetical protein